MKIIVDAFGGDNAPLEILKGCEMAVNELDVDIILTGNEELIHKVMTENSISKNKMEIVNAQSVMTMEDDPTAILRQKKDSSMAVGLSLLTEGKGDAFVSAGNTGALLSGATLIVKRIKGIKRAALAPILPTNNGHAMLIDGGANIENKAEYLAQFGVMGSAYMEKIMKVKNPKVGLVNVGAEDTKGGELQLEAFKLLKEMPVNFIGNIEGRDIPLGTADVVVADGFTGNVILKTVEGMGIAFSKNLKDVFYKNIITKIAALLLKNELKAFKKKMDYTETGGAPLMGIAKPVIKAHGSSNAKAFKNAIRQAKLFCENEVIKAIEDCLKNS